MLGYRINLYFHEYKLAIEIDENVYRNIDCEIKRQKAAERELGHEFIRIDLDNENFNIFKAINEIFKHIKQLSNQLAKQSTKKICWVNFQRDYKDQSFIQITR